MTKRSADWSILILASSLAGCGPPPDPAPPASDSDGIPQVPEEPAERTTAAAPAEPPSDEPSADEPTAQEQPNTPRARPGLSDGETRTMKVIQNVIVENRDFFRSCYDKAQAKVPELKGDMVLHFVLDSGGKVKKAELNEPRSTIKNDELTQCAITELRKLDFPASSKGLETSVNYPFNFNPR